MTLDLYVKIIDNVIQDNQIGVFLNYASPNSDTTVKDNLIQNNNQGIYSHWSNNNHIKDNVVINNEGHGIECIRSFYGKITNNIIKNNGEYGIYLRGSSNNGFIKNNNIEENKEGVRIENSNKILIKNNNFINNKIQAYFKNSFFNKWKSNYWNDWVRILPRKIKGTINFREIPWRNYDWFPRLKLNNN